MTARLHSPSLLSLLFFSSPTEPVTRGRVIRFDGAMPEEGKNLSAAAARKRITQYLQEEQAPCTMEEIILAVGLKRTQINQHLQVLMQAGAVHKYKRSGYPTEYTLIA